MAGLGIGLIVVGYAAWYTLYQKTWGEGGSMLYWLTGSTRFSGPATAKSGGGGGGGGPTVAGNPGIPRGGGGNQTGAGPGGGLAK